MGDGMFEAFRHDLWQEMIGGRRKPKLELLERRPAKPRLKTPVLFVHGAYTGAWCWEDYFLPYFAEQGIHAFAVSLRGHGRSEGRQMLAATSLADYVDDHRARV